MNFKSYKPPQDIPNDPGGQGYARERSPPAPGGHHHYDPFGNYPGKVFFSHYLGFNLTFAPISR